jgi:peptide/nickel transport system ATP-binding protein
LVTLTKKGCPFFDRCPLAIKGTCDEQTPPVRRLANNHSIECHLDEAHFSQ